MNSILSSCLDPYLAYQTSRGSKKLRIIGKVKLLDRNQFFKFIDFSNNNFSIKNAYNLRYYLIPCRKCVACQVLRSSEWTKRLINESKYYDKDNILFITLTYDNDNLSLSDYVLKIPTLQKSHCQSFLKRLRKYFKEKKIRYFLSGEYGTKTKRPHYHIIIFGLSLNDFQDIEKDSVSPEGFQYYHSLILEKKIWKKGKVIIANADEKTFGYTANYVIKGTKGYIDYDSLKLQAPFILMSKRPSIGLQYILDNRKKIEKDGYFFSHYS